MHRDPRWAGIDPVACYHYTVSRQTPDGGFCFYASPEWRVAEPNAPDTRAAIAIMSLLDRSVPHVEQCTAWLKEQQDQSGGFATLIIGFAVLKALRGLGAEPLRNPRGYLEVQGRNLWSPDRSSRNLVGWLASASRCIALRHEHTMSLTGRMRASITEILRKLSNHDGGYGTPGSSLPETAAAAVIADRLGLDPNPAVLAYVRSCEGMPYGFNIAPSGAGSNLEAQCAGMLVVRRFGAKPRYPVEIRSYVAACQTSTGGFGRAPGAIARLDDTHRALAILSALP